MKSSISIVAALSLMLVSSSAMARKWTDSSGKFSVEAELVKVTGNRVVLRRTDGRLLNIAVARLSTADRDFLKHPDRAGGNGAAEPTHRAVGDKPERSQKPGSKVKLVWTGISLNPKLTAWHAVMLGHPDGVCVVPMQDPNLPTEFRSSGAVFFKSGRRQGYRTTARWQGHNIEVWVDEKGETTFRLDGEEVPESEDEKIEQTARTALLIVLLKSAKSMPEQKNAKPKGKKKGKPSR